jgi:ATP-binding cassette, subfamily B, bacterial
VGSGLEALSNPRGQPYYRYNGMSLKIDPPRAVLDLLAAESVDTRGLLLCTNTDIDGLGTYKPQWLVVNSDGLWVASDGASPEILVRLAFKDVTEFRCQGTVGSGLLQARTEGVFVDVLRYSNRYGDRFNKVARKLDRHLKGEPIIIHPDDAVDPRRCPTCGLMLQFVGDTCPRCVSKGAVLSRMWKLMRPYRAAVIMVMCLLFAGICLDLVGPKLTQYLVDNVLPGNKEAAIAIHSDPGQLWHHTYMLLCVVGILACVQICRQGVNMVNGRLGARIGTSITADMRSRLVEHLQKLSVSFYDRQQVGSLVGRVAYDTESLHGFVNQLTGGFLFQLIMIVGVGIMMFTINVKLACYTLIPAPLVITGSIVFWRYIYPRYYKVWDASSKQAGMLSGVLSGIRVVKAFSQEKAEVNKFGTASNYLKDSRRNVDYAVSTFNPTMGIVFQLGGWIVWYVGGREVIGGDMTLGKLMAFFGYLWMFYGPLGNLSQFTNWLTQFVTQAHRIFEILDTPVEIMDAKETVSIKQMKGDLKFEKVTFGYNRHQRVLNDVDLEIPAGQMVGIVGRSGSGKTTLVNLLCRFYDVDEGVVSIDGVDVRKLQLDQLRSQIGVVLQEPFLFRGSIWDNVTYGRPESTVEEVITAAKAGNCHDFIMRNAHGYDTWVGERGAGLSGGERQRISISRVLLTDPRVLILDEATSSVDAESEAAIQEALAEVVKGRTTIAIAHRLSTLRRANRIIVIDHGKVAESGTHDELIAKEGIYARLLKIQGQKHMPTVEQLSVESERAKKAMDDDEEAGSMLPPLKGHHPRWLTPENSVVHLGSLNALHVTVKNEAIYGGVFAVRCLPVRHPRKYISLRYFDKDKHEVEVGLIRDLDEWGARTQKLVDESLLKRYFVHTITAINGIELFNGYLNFNVETDLGPVEFMMRWQGDKAHNFGTSGRMLIDSDENRYLIPDLQKLGEPERRLFLRFIYW